MNPLAVLTRPGEFFTRLAAGPPRRAAAFGAVLAYVAISVGLPFVVVMRGGGPSTLEPLRQLLGQLEVGLLPFALGMLLALPPAALLVWGVSWLPVRLAAGRSPRTAEVVAWAQIPPAAVVPFQLVVASASLVWAQVLAWVALAASAWVVHAGLAVFAPERARRGTVAYVLFFVVLAGLQVLLARGAAPSGGGVVL